MERRSEEGPGSRKRLAGTYAGDVAITAGVDVAFATASNCRGVF
jgi:hypothetical protein